MTNTMTTRRGQAMSRSARALLAGVLALAGVAAVATLTEPVLASRLQTAAPEAVLGDWAGTMTGDPQLPPEGAPFVLRLELDDEGAIIGSFELGEGEFVLDVQDAEYIEGDHRFSCRLVTFAQDQEISADLTATVDGDEMSGTIAADGFEAGFTASREG